jgi:hypothetical protein
LLPEWWLLNFGPADVDQSAGPFYFLGENGPPRSGRLNAVCTLSGTTLGAAAIERWHVNLLASLFIFSGCCSSFRTATLNICGFQSPPNAVRLGAQV